MSRLLSRHALRSVLVVVVACGLGACGDGRLPSASRAVPPARPTDGASATTSTTAGPADDADEHGDGGLLTPARRGQLGLTGAGGAGALTPQQWSDPQAVAAHWVLADTTYAAAEEPAAVNSRRAAYATPRLVADLATSSSGGARLEELRRRQARYAGEVLAVTTNQSSIDVAVVQVRAAVTLRTSDQPPDRRARFYQVTLGREPGGRWLVARAEQS